MLAPVADRLALFQETAESSRHQEQECADRDDTVTYFDYISTASLIWIKLPPTNFSYVR